MTTRALQLESLLTPVTDHNTGSICGAGYTVYFYAAGTSTAKNVWTEKEKTNPYTSRSMGTDGSVQVYGEGVYKIVIKDADDDTIHEWDNIKIEAYNHSITTKTVNYTATADDDIILVDTSGGNRTISLDPVANFSHPITIKNTGGNTVTVDPDGSETIDGAATDSLTTENKTMTLYPDTTGGEWKKSERDESYLSDADGDTKIQVEESADEDKIRMDTGGTQRVLIDSTVLQSTVRIQPDANFSDGTYDINFPANGMADAIFMLGNTDTVVWFYLNAAPPGWSVQATGADAGLAIAGGSDAYDVNGGNIAGETWANLKAHVHTGPSHNHEHNHIWYNDAGAGSADDTGDSGGDLVDISAGSQKTAGSLYHIARSDSQADWPLGDSWTNDDSTAGGTGNTGGQSTSDVRPTAAVGKLFRLDAP